MINLTIRKTAFATAALAFIVAGAPAQASDAAEGNKMDSASGTSSTPAPQGREKRYCVVEQVTGSRLPVKICKTMKEWQAEGVEVKAR